MIKWQAIKAYDLFCGNIYFTYIPLISAFSKAGRMTFAFKNEVKSRRNIYNAKNTTRYVYMLLQLP